MESSSDEIIEEDELIPAIPVDYDDEESEIEQEDEGLIEED